MSLFCCPKLHLALWICLSEKPLTSLCLSKQCGLVLHCSFQWVLTAEHSESISTAQFIHSLMFPVASMAVLTLDSSAAQNHVFQVHLFLIRVLPNICLLTGSALTALLSILNSSIWPQFGSGSSILNLCNVVLEFRWLIPSSQAEDHSYQYGAIWIILPHSVGAIGYDCCIIKYGCKSRHSGCPSLFNSVKAISTWTA